MKEKVYKYLDDLGITYEVVNHPIATTTELADKYIQGYEGVRTKTMFLYNKNKTNFYLIVLDENQRVDFKYLEELLNENKIKFAADEVLINKLGLRKGIVSIFGLLNNTENITVLLDKSINRGIPITFHPNMNDATIFISYEDTIKFLEFLKVKHIDINMN